LAEKDHDCINRSEFSQINDSQSVLHFIEIVSLFLNYYYNIL